MTKETTNEMDANDNRDANNASGNGDERPKRKRTRVGDLRKQSYDVSPDQRDRNPYKTTDSSERPYGGDRREGGYRDDNRSSGGYRGGDSHQPSGDRSYGGGGYRGNDNRQSGGYRSNDNRSSGDRPYGGGGYRSNDNRQSGGYRGNDSRPSGDRSYGGDRREGGYRSNDNRQSGGYRGNDNRSSGDRSYGGDRREGGYRSNDNRQSGGYRGNDNRSSGDRSYGGDRREGGYRSNDNRQSGGYKPRQGGGRFDNRNSQGGGRSFQKPKNTYRGPDDVTQPVKYKENLDPDTPIRLNKYLANAGVCSRREADAFITAGVVKVNGEVVNELGSRVSIGDIVSFKDEAINLESKVYVLLNKPRNCVTTSDDPQNRTTVMDLVHGACRERIYPVGRLDRNTTGVLLLTNDGDLASKLMHPKYKKKKIYQVTLDKPVAMEDMQAIADGIELEDGEIHADSIEYQSEEELNVVGIELHSGKNRIVRRIFEHLNYKVEQLDRVYFAGLTKKNVRRGRWRYLTEKEVNMLRMGAFE